MRPSRLALLFVAGLAVATAGCRTTLKLPESQTQLVGKRPYLAGTTICVLPFADQRPDQSSIGVYRDNIQRQTTSTYDPQRPVGELVQSLVASTYASAGATVVSDGACTVQIGGEVRALSVTVDGMMAGEETFGEIELRVAIFDAAGFAIGAQTLSKQFTDESRASESMLGAELERLVAELIDHEGIVALIDTARSNGAVATLDNPAAVVPNVPAVAPPDAPNPGDEPEPAQELDQARVYLRCSGEHAGELDKLVVRFQSAVLKHKGIEFAGAVDMEQVYAECRTDVGVSADTERQCQLQAARRIFVDQVIEISARKRAAGGFELSMEVWDPDSNALVAAEIIQSDERALDDAAAAALPTLGCLYVRSRGARVDCGE